MLLVSYRPMLVRFPPKNAKPRPGSLTSSASVSVFPSFTLAQSELWDEKVRERLKTPRYKKKDIDDRRSKVCSLALSFVQSINTMFLIGLSCSSLVQPLHRCDKMTAFLQFSYSARWRPHQRQVARNGRMMERLVSMVGHSFSPPAGRWPFLCP